MNNFAPPNPNARREVEAMLKQLDRELQDSMRLAFEAQRGGIIDGLARYRKYRDRVQSFQALVALLEDRLTSLSDDITPEMRIQVDRSDAQMMLLMVESSGRFFDALLRSSDIPFGTREAAVTEKRTLTSLSERLDQADYAGERAMALRAELDRVLGVVQQIIERSPSLPEF